MNTVNKKNFASGSITTAPSPATSGTSLVLTTGHGARMPAVPFYATLYPPNQLPTIENSEVVYVSARTTETLTIERAKRGTTAKTVEDGWQISNALYIEDLAPHAGEMSALLPMAQFTDMLPLDASAYDYYAGGGSVAHDTGDKMMGSASLRVITDGAGGFEGGAYDFSPAKNWTNKRFRIWVKCDDWNGLDLATIMISTSGFFDSFFFAHVNLGISSPQNNEWIEVLLDAHNFAGSGTPDWSTVNHIIFRAADDGGDPITFRWDGFGVFDRGPKGFVSITFDDGWGDNYTLAKPILDKFGIRGTHYIIPELLGETSRMTQAQVDDLHRQGHEISGHGATSLVDLTISDGIDYVEEYLRYVKTWAVEHGYRGQDLWAYPNGNSTPEIQDTVLKYFSVARALGVCGQPTSAVNPRHVSARTVVGTSDTSAGLIAEIDAAITGQDWLILVFHHITSGAATVDTEFSAANFEAVLQHIYDEGYACFPVGETIRRLTT